MSGIQDVSREAGGHFRSASDLSLEDALQRRLRYHLLRLTLAGLSRDETKALVELGRLAFRDADVSQQATAIRERADASPLAYAIADIVEQGASGRAAAGGLRAVMLGAVLGAYAALDGAIPDDERPAAAILGAVGGAVAASTSSAIRANIEQLGTVEYLQAGE